jgi:hypothetical protein
MLSWNLIRCTRYILKVHFKKLIGILPTKV